MHKTVTTPTLEIAYLEAGPADGPPVILLHGWPSDPHDWDAVVPPLATAGCRVLTPRLRADALPRSRHPALRPAGRAGRRSARFHGRAGHRPGDPGRLRLGRPRRLLGRRTVAGAGARPGLHHRLQRPEHS